MARLCIGETGLLFTFARAPTREEDTRLEKQRLCARGRATLCGATRREFTASSLVYRRRERRGRGVSRVSAINRNKSPSCRSRVVNRGNRSSESLPCRQFAVIDRASVRKWQRRRFARNGSDTRPSCWFEPRFAFSFRETHAIARNPRLHPRAYILAFLRRPSAPA